MRPLWPRFFQQIQLETGTTHNTLFQIAHFAENGISFFGPFRGPFGLSRHNFFVQAMEPKDNSAWDKSEQSYTFKKDTSHVLYLRTCYES